MTLQCKLRPENLFYQSPVFLAWMNACGLIPDNDMTKIDPGRN